MITRRSLLKTGGMAAVGSLTIGTAACGKNLTTYTSIIISALEELSPLLPGQSSFIANAIKIARDFDEAYRAGKFANATTLFANLAGVIGQIADSVGVTSPAVKTTIAIAGVAMRAIAILLKEQSTQPAVTAAVRAQRSTAAVAHMGVIDRLADAAAADAVFQASKP